MSIFNTFLFEEINAGGTLTNKDSLIYPTAAHKNATSGYVTIAYRKGRYGQTEGNILGDVNGHIPACPYHMPRNSRRFEEPRLHISKKTIGDVIQASDINNLIDKIRLFQYAWEAEANNIYGYNAVTGYPNAKVDTSRLTYIEAENAPQPTFSIHDSKISGSIQNEIPRDANIFSCHGDSLASVVTQLNNAIATKINTFVTFGTVLFHGFPEDMDDLNNNDTHTLIHAGHSPIVGVKAIQFMEAGNISPNFKLQYLSGTKIADGGIENGHVKGKDSVDMIFNYNTSYVISYLPDNQPDTQPKYIGFTLYYLGNDIVKNLPTTEIVTKTVTAIQSYGISNFGTMSKRLFGSDLTMDTSKTVIPAITTQPIHYNFAQTINNINTSYPDPSGEGIHVDQMGDTFWNKFLPRMDYESDSSYKVRLNAVKAKFNSMPIKTLNIPAQKLMDGKCWRQAPDGSWIEQSYIFIFQAMQIDIQKTNYTFDGDGNFLMEYVQGFKIYAGKWSPATQKVEWNAGAPFSTFKSKPAPAGSPTYLQNQFYDFDDSFLADPISWVSGRQFVSEGLNDNSEYGFPYFIDNFVMYEDYVSDDTGANQQFTYFNENGVGKVTMDQYFGMIDISTVGQLTYFYGVGMSCPDGSEPVNGVCSVTTTEIVTIANLVDTNYANSLKVLEGDITYRKGIYFVGEKNYPKIKSADFKNIRNVLNKFLTNIIALSQSQINNGTPDSETYQELSNFLSNQAASANTYDQDDPDTSFEGYDARQNGIIKLNFYNILVDAYKLIINGCICNADCACNLVCACNTNCGCNYGG